MNDLTDAIRFDLDERQRAMLAEMGVRLWQAPQSRSVDAVAAASAAEAATPGAAPARPTGTRPAERPASAAQRPQRPVLETAATPLTAAALANPAQAPVLMAGSVPDLQGIAHGDWAALEQAVAACRACDLAQTRKQTVFGIGARQAHWMVIGEAPGQQEDAQGLPFVGPAGQLLDNMLKAIGVSREGQGAQGAYIANTLKCRPPGNRNPQPQEMEKCAPYLERQVAWVQPRVILAMGRFAVQFLLATEEPIGRLRGRVHQYAGVPVIVTYHPAYLLRNLPDKAKAWEDLCLAVQVMQQHKD